jgi:hypothetical protein
MLKVINVVGARPNFMKVAPIVEAMRGRASESCARAPGRSRKFFPAEARRG